MHRIPARWLSVLAITLSGCGAPTASVATMATPPASPSPSPSASASVALSASGAVTPSPSPTPLPATPVAPAELDCAPELAALATVGAALEVFIQLTDDAQYAALADPGSPLHLSAADYRAGVETLALVPGSEEEVADLRALADLLDQNVASGTPPFAGPRGRNFLDRATAAFGTVQMGLSQDLEEAGCEPA